MGHVRVDIAMSLDGFVADEFFTLTGAFILGQRTFDVGEDPCGEDGAFGRPCFVLTHRARPKLVRGPTTITLVTGGAVSALAQAQAAAGERDVCVMGGATVVQQYLQAGLVDELQIHIANVLLGAGTRLFDISGGEVTPLERTRVIESPFATHLRFAVHTEEKR